MRGLPFAVTTLRKILLVLGAYLLAVLVACAVLNAYVSATRGPDRDLSSGMYAFGDSLLFLWVFGVAAIPGSALALFFLRPHRVFWTISCALALLIALTGIAALIGFFAFRTADPHSALGIWAMASPLRIVLAPLFALAFALAGIFVPQRMLRGLFFAASLAEAAIFGGMALSLWRSM